MTQLHVFFAALALVALPAAATPLYYELYDLGASQNPMGQNASREIAGATSNDGFPPDTAETWRNGVWTILKNQGPQSQAEAINKKGVAAGEDGPNVVTWRKGKRIVLSGIEADSTAESIANDGTIVGTDGQGEDSACYSWSNGAVTILGTLGGMGCQAHTIDSTGKYIGGASRPAVGGLHAFIHDAAGMHDLGVLSGSGFNSSTISVNKRGHASVSSDRDNSGDHAACYWNGFGLVEVPGVFEPAGESYAGSINDSDQMVVLGQDASGNVLFLYDGDAGTVTPIEPLIRNAGGWQFDLNVYTRTLTIGDDGAITGTAEFNGEEHGYLLVPVVR